MTTAANALHTCAGGRGRGFDTYTCMTRNGRMQLNIYIIHHIYISWTEHGRHPIPTPRHVYSLQDSRIPLDQLTVRHLTRILSARKRKHPPAKAAWQARLNVKDHVWEDAASRCTTTFLTPRDVHTHFKHIIHRALTTREREDSPPNTNTAPYAACAGSEKKTPCTWGNAT